MPGAERRFRPFVEFIQKDCGWETEFVRFDWPAHNPPFGSDALFPQVDAQTEGVRRMGSGEWGQAEFCCSLVRLHWLNEPRSRSQPITPESSRISAP